MAQRISYNYLLARVIRINEHPVFKASERYKRGDRFSIDTTNGSYCLHLVHANTSETDISPRGTARETADFITGVLVGLDLAAE